MQVDINPIAMQSQPLCNKSFFLTAKIVVCKAEPAYLFDLQDPSYIRYVIMIGDIILTTSQSFIVLFPLSRVLTLEKNIFTVWFEDQI
jgi:hypothetical protein